MARFLFSEKSVPVCTHAENFPKNEVVAPCSTRQKKRREKRKAAKVYTYVYYFPLLRSVNSVCYCNLELTLVAIPMNGYLDVRSSLEVT